MRFIAHRGNLLGRNIDRENRPDYIDEAIVGGFDVEVDVWSMPNDQHHFYLGHDKAQYKIPKSWLIDRVDNLWVHCKSIRALDWCVSNGIHAFAHDTDYATLTTLKFIWAYPGREILSNDQNVVCVLPERNESTKHLEFGYWDFGAICSDYIRLVKDRIHV